VFNITTVLKDSSFQALRHNNGAKILINSRQPCQNATAVLKH